MGLLDDAKDKLGGDKLQEGVEKGGDFVDDKTGGEHADKIDKAQDFANDKLGGGEGGDAPQQ